MRRLTVLFVGVISISAMLVGCAATPQDIAYKKLGVSHTKQKSDSQTCWAQAQSARQPKDVEAAVAVGTIIGAGLVGVAVLMASKAAENSDSKNVYRRDAHGRCMQKRGYKATGFVPPAKPNNTSPRKSKIAGKQTKPRRTKRPQCYTFTKCMKLCSSGDLPESQSPTYCDYTCSNQVKIC